MKAAGLIIPLFVGASLLGCAPTGKNHHQSATDNTPPATLVKAAILQDLGLRGQHPNKNFGAFFVHVDKPEVPFFENLFKDNIPRAEFSADPKGRFPNLDTSGGGVLDKKTGKPGAILGFQKVEIKNEEARVEFIESYGSLGITAHEYSLSLLNGKWTVRKRSKNTLS